MAGWLVIPRIDARYWLAILFASIFGTNLGDLYAHDSGLGIGAGLALLTALVATLFVIARATAGKVELFYWLVIAIIRTGATNIADFLFFRVRINGALLVIGLAGLLALFAWLHRRCAVNQTQALPPPDVNYWCAMLAAGVFGTVAGDMSQFLIGHAGASLALTGLLAILLWSKGVSVRSALTYWSILAVARTAGTAVGDWLAEDKMLAIGLPLATLISGIGFAAVLLFWPRSTNHGEAVAT